MCVDDLNPMIDALRVDLIDSWHKCWPVVLRNFDEQGRQGRLLVDPDGWLSARQVLYVAFSGRSVAGHLLFRLVPGLRGARVDVDARPSVDAQLDSFEVSPGFEGTTVRDELLKAAMLRAGELQVGRFEGI